MFSSFRSCPVSFVIYPSELLKKCLDTVSPAKQEKPKKNIKAQFLCSGQRTYYFMFDVL